MPEISPGRSDRLSVVDKGMVRLTWPTNPGGIGPGLEPPSVRDRVIISNIIANFVHDHE